MKAGAGAGAKQNVSLEQGVQVSTATQRAETTTRHCHTEKLSGDNYQPLILIKTRKEGGKKEGQTAAQRQEL